jgi:multidrug efflux pump subunit AcrB/uncharacterized membrane protein YhaH (DUF805 family)
VGEDEYDIVVRYLQPFRGKVEDVENATVFFEGKNIPVSAFAETEFGTGLAAVHRIDARRVVTVSADAAAGYNANALLAQVQETLADYSLAPGYNIEFTGESEDQEEASEFLSNAFLMAIMLIFVVLVSQFSSVTVPAVILSSVILSLIGVFTGLMVTHTPFGIIMTGVGVISLAGIVVNNAIVLLDYIIQLRDRGMDKTEAIIRAGMTRFRPVILTALTTILGLIPLTTGLAVDFSALTRGDFGRALVIGGESSQWWGPMGVAVIWGLAVATFLTLVVVPVMYSTLDPIKRSFMNYWLGVVLREYGQFSGRAHRTKYWSFFGWNIVFSLVVFVIDGQMSRPGILTGIYGLGVLVPWLGLGWRRMHDSGRSGWWYLIPVVGLVFLFWPGSKGENRFGAPPEGTKQGNP